jgi:hypothetical protein
MDVGEVECSTAKVETIGRAVWEELEVKETAAELQEGVYMAMDLLDLRQSA